MVFYFTTNNTPVTGTHLVFSLMSFLTTPTIGWTVKASGDGLSAFSNTSNILTSASSGANGLGNSNAWFRIQAPNGVREFVFQRGTVSTNWKIKYSAVSKFTNGGSSTVMPTATDEQFIQGSSGAFGVWLGTDNTYHWNMGADSSDGYGFWSVAHTNGTVASPTLSGAIVMDPLKIGSFLSIDIDPVVLFCPLPSTISFNADTSNLLANVFRGWHYRGTPSESFVSLSSFSLSVSNTRRMPNSIGINQYNMKDILFSLLIGRVSTGAITTTPPPYFMKGETTLMKFNGIGHRNFDLLSVSGTKDRVVYGDVSLPWNGKGFLI